MTGTRRIVQAASLCLILIAVFAIRGDAEKWCPFGGIEALYGFAREGAMPCSLGIANFYALGALVAVTLFVRRAFCAYLCPIGTISEWIRAAGRRIGIRAVEASRRWDRGLGFAKVGILALILAATWHAGELVFRGYDPCYALIGRHGEDITAWAYVISAAIAIASLWMSLPFCRWLCPLAAAIDPVSRLGIARVRRDAAACTDCGACARACPMRIPVDAMDEVRSAACTSCLACIDACPSPSPGGALAWGPRRGRRWPQAALVAILAAAVAAAGIGAYAAPIPSFSRERGEPPDLVATLDLRIKGVTCRGAATLLAYFLERDDISRLAGYLRIEAWPGSGSARVRIAYDPARSDPRAIREAIIEPYYDAEQGFERHSPFEIEGYAPWEDE